MSHAAPERLRRAPQQARARERVERVLDAADHVLADEGADALSTVRVAEVAGISIGSLYHYFPDKEALVEALAVRHWSDFKDLALAVAEADRAAPLDHPARAILETLAAAFRARKGFRAIWYGGLRTQRVRDVTRGTRTGFAQAIERMIATHWPQSAPELRAEVAAMVVLLGDGLLREAFRLSPDGDAKLLGEAEFVLENYMSARLGGRG